MMKNNLTKEKADGTTNIPSAFVIKVLIKMIYKAKSYHTISFELNKLERY